MTGSKVDPRVVKTRSSLRKALVYLMKHEKLENISVQKITETANITSRYVLSALQRQA